MTSNRQKLLDIVQEFQLSQTDIAMLTTYSLDSVKGWMASPESDRARSVPDRAIELLQLKLGKTITE